MNAVECLAFKWRRKRTEPELKVLAELSAHVNTSCLKAEQKKRLKNALGNLKQESHGSACRRLIKDLVGDQEADAFAGHYTIRGNLLHKGSPGVTVDIDDQVCRLRHIVRRLIIASTNKSIGATRPR